MTKKQTASTRKKGNRRQRGMVQALLVVLVVAACVGLFFLPQVFAGNREPQKITLNQSDMLIAMQDTPVQLWAHVTPNSVAAEDLYWFSSDSEVASVTGDGYVIPKSVGETTVTVATNLEKTNFTTCSVQVVAAPESITLSLPKLDAFLTLDDITLSAMVLPTDASGYTLTWTSSDDSIASVDQSGHVTLKSVGDANIIVTTGNGLSDSCALRVRAPITAIELNKTALSLEALSEEQLLALPTGVEGADQTVTWRSSNTAVAVVSADGIVKGVDAGTCTITATAVDSKNVSADCTVTVSKRTTKIVALTFDDGPCKNTRKILALLDKYNIKATFFMVGEQVDSYPEIAKEVADAGHEIGNHTYNHKNLKTSDLDVAKKQLEKNDAAIYAATGAYPTVIRAPGGSITNERIQEIGDPRYYIYWSVDTRDWESRDASSVYSTCMKHVGDMSVILCHDLYSSTTEAMERIIPKLIEDGYSFVTVSELMEITGTDGPQYARS